MISSFNSQITEGFEIGGRLKLDAAGHEIINIIGMGGSALPGEFLKSLIGPAELHINIHRNCGYSKAFEQGLNICISYSGNTEETLDAFSSIIGRGYDCVAISSGGRLEQEAIDNGIPFAKVREGLVPRLALPLMSSVLVSLLASNGVIARTRPPNYNANNETERIGEALSEPLHKKIPLFYSSQRNRIVSLAGKIAVNENSKSQAFYNVMPELNHNEMNGFEVLNGSYSAVLIKDQGDSGRNKERIKLTEELLTRKNVPVHSVELPDADRFSQLIFGIQAMFWASYFLSERYGVDAMNVPVVDWFKKSLS